MTKPDLVYLKGDNLPILKNLDVSFDMVYLDPPYNINAKTAYTDTYSVDNLSLLLELVKLNEGAILFCHVSEKYIYQYLKCFEEHGFEKITTFIRLKKGYYQSRVIAEKHEYVLCYANKKEKWLDKPLLEYGFGNEYVASLQKTGQYGSIYDRPTMAYPILNPEGKLTFPIKSDGTMGRWIWSEKTFKKRINEIVWRNDKPYIKTRSKGVMATILTDEPKKEYEQLRQLGIKTEGLWPKSRELIKKLILFSRVRDGNILDPFGGTGTTVLANREVGLNNNLYIIERDPYMQDILEKRCFNA